MINSQRSNQPYNKSGKYPSYLSWTDGMNTEITKIDLPFAKGFALQEYLSAEEGIVQAINNYCLYWYVDGSLVGESPECWDIKRIADIKNLIEKYNVKPIYHGNYKVPLASDVNDLREAALKYVKKEIDLAAKLEAPLIIHAGAVVEPRLVNKTKKIALNNYVSSLLDLHEYAAQQGVSLFLENLSNYKHYRPFHYIFTEEHEFEYVLSAIPDVKFFLDIGHANIGNGSPDKIINRFHKNIVGMSFSNNDGLRDQHLALGKGTINYANVVSEILKCNWRGIVGFETRGRELIRSVADLNEIYEAIQSIAYAN